MKKNFACITLVTFATLAFYSCKKDSITNTTTPVTTDSLPTYASFKTLMDNGFYNTIQKANFDASNTAFTYTSPKGTTITIDGTCLRKDGAPVSGEVTLEFFEAYKNTDMLMANKPTMGVKSDGSYEALLSAGQYYVAVSQKGRSLTSACGVHIRAKIINSGSRDPEMKPFNGVVTDSGLSWQQAKDWQITVDSPNNMYDFSVPGLGWYNCDKFMDDPRPKTNIKIQYPKGYEKASIVYLIDKSMPQFLGITYWGQWPVGMQCYLIFATEKNGKYRWQIKQTTLVKDHAVSFEINNTQTGTQKDYENAIIALQ